jgi:hypothetical protein
MKWGKRARKRGPPFFFISPSRDAHHPANGNGRQFEKSRRLRSVNKTADELIFSKVGRYEKSKKASWNWNWNWNWNWSSIDAVPGQMAMQQYY